MNIPLFNIKKNYTNQKSAIDRAIKGVLKDCNFILGKNVELFEKEFANYLGVKYAVGVGSGTDALILSLRALNLKTSDEVIIPANSYPTAFAVAAVATPRLVDINPGTLNMDPRGLEKAITKRTKAIIPIHLYGLAAELEPIISIAKKHQIFIIEDASQAHGAKYKGRKAGSIGNLGCFSFYPTKNLGAIGDGGVVVTNSPRLAKDVRALRMYGEKKRYQSFRLGIVSRLDELQAAVLREKLKKLDFYNKKRRRIADYYFTYLKNSPFILPPKGLDSSHVYHLFTIQTENRDKIHNYLTTKGVYTGNGYPPPTHFIKSFSFLGYHKGDFPNAESVSGKIITLPCYPELEKKEVKAICNFLENALK